MLSSMIAFLILISAPILTQAQTCPARGLSPWALSRFHRLITFGDSYTDESRLQYMIDHNGTPPSPGTFLPESTLLRNWARHVAVDTGLDLRNYAVSGAVCSNLITPRPFPVIRDDFPSVLEYEVPAYLAERDVKHDKSDQPIYEPPFDSTTTVFALMVGTNDLGNIAFLTDSQVAGKVLRDYTQCLFDVLDRLYASGARHFLLFNTMPLHLAPQYANDTLHGRPATRYWPDKPSNLTATAIKMLQQTTSANEILRYQTPYEVLVARRYPGAHVALFDLFELISDIHADPAQYLDRAILTKASDYEHHCDVTGEVRAYEYDHAYPDSFMWWDELHPSGRVHEIIAREVAQVLEGQFRYASYWSGGD
ncbi:hypothetical protein LTR91_021344 [Friedmanniomyces endolithicus]|uniref:SGNH hydrolase-type esterase domain-containing protein n=1 Tax=Friedmanniomyces endolithicus TaxID=329885 RepID=A0AAN6H855_9PEZI|nr:hypothetical protein LTR94_004753 [Friedmanniomyces endolithicus]KAK0813904.1 hypothetical protein LTR59_001060 [Friedmanniomyces endolithicus]KAK0819623.1 hypothetical protein LTR38_000376 [Friedmanniomyces endolithicus]KAK0822110.1 hypothetical protein LTR75_000245 [Friedmanniomyces endolithicus]KAK0858339.1 hypothetical protein LTR03_000348 [Friedmanniomyces endolithicus]